VLEGEYLMYVEDRQQLCPPGTFVYVPRNTPHTFKVVSAVPGKKLNLFSPAAMLGFLRSWPQPKRPEMPHRNCWTASPPGTTCRYSGRRRPPICEPKPRNP
jgi:hypothetical protein